MAGPVTAKARAKINLALHVTGRRSDGYHLIDSVVTFAEFGDELRFTAADADGFSLSGRFAPQLAGAGGCTDGNLVLKARDLLRRELIATGQPAPPVVIHLEKALPVAAGLGGGSADAAATLSGLLQLWGGSVSAARLADMALSLGADVPMCLTGRPLLARGIGEDVTPLADLPAFSLVIGNPLQPVSTAEVFQRLERRDNAPIVLPPGDERDWPRSLAAMRNDLEASACRILPEIAELCALIHAEGAFLTRMSGSGASCFGFFADMDAASEAAHRLERQRPGWYFRATTTL